MLAPADRSALYKILSLQSINSNMAFTLKKRGGGSEGRGGSEEERGSEGGQERNMGREVRNGGISLKPSSHLTTPTRAITAIPSSIPAYIRVRNGHQSALVHATRLN